MKQLATTILCAALLAGCAPYRDNGGVIVDRQGVDPARYDADLRECKSYALEVKPGEKVATGAAVGAAVGGAIGVITGHHPGRNAGVGAVAGGTHGAIASDEEQRRVIRNCMRNRGYQVLN